MSKNSKIVENYIKLETKLSYSFPIEKKKKKLLQNVNKIKIEIAFILKKSLQSMI